MKFGSYILALTIALTFAVNANAQNKEVSVLPEIKNEIGTSATSNIENAERLFCYKVAPKPKNYDGYTINNMAITGFCGVIDENLQQINSDYEAKRYKNITLQPLELIKARPSVFNDWLKQKGKLGGQHKVPRLCNNRDIIEQILVLNAEI